MLKRQTLMQSWSISRPYWTENPWQQNICPFHDTFLTVDWFHSILPVNCLNYAAMSSPHQSPV